MKVQTCYQENRETIFKRKKTSKSTCTTISLQCTEQVSSHVKVKVKSLSRVRLFVTPWTVARQAPLSMGFCSQEYWSGLPFPSPGDLPDPGIKPGSPTLEANALTSEPPGKPAQSHRKHQFWWRRKGVYSWQVSHIFPWCWRPLTETIVFSETYSLKLWLSSWQ